MNVLVFPLETQVEQSQGVSHQVQLGFLVESALSGEAGRVVDLNQPWFVSVVQHNIEAQDMKAHLVLQILRLASPVEVGHERLTGDDGLNDDVLDLQLQIVHNFLALLPLLEDDLAVHLGETPLVTHSEPVLVVILDKNLVVLVDRVVCQVHEHVLEIGRLRRLELLSSKPGQAFFIQVDAQWVNAVEQHVDPHVEFEPVNQVWVLDVLLRHEVSSRIDVLPFVGEENALALAFVLRLNYKNFVVDY